MFDLVLYAVAVVGVLAFVRPARTQRRQVLTTLDTIHSLNILPSIDECFEDDEAIACRPITCPWERASAIALADEIIAACDRARAAREVIDTAQLLADADADLEAYEFLDECEAIAPTVKRVQLPTDAAALRALCNLYGFPVPKHGRVSAYWQRRLVAAVA